MEKGEIKMITKENFYKYMSLASARKMGIIIDENDILELFHHGLIVDIAIRKPNEKDILSGG